jgi:hypothetical protein
MGIAISALSAFQHVFTPLHQLVDWLLPTSQSEVARNVTARAAPAPHLVRPGPARPGPARPQGVLITNPCAHRPLRVVRVLDPGKPRSGHVSARMVISGRMADVCAELDRLAAAEAASDIRH